MSRVLLGRLGSDGRETCRGPFSWRDFWLSKHELVIRVVVVVSIASIRFRTLIQNENSH